MKNEKKSDAAQDAELTDQELERAVGVSSTVTL